MILSRRVALGGVQLDEIHEAIVIRGIDTGVPKESIQSVNRMGGVGQRVTMQHWETMEVTVNWAMDIQKDDLATRREIWEAVNSWALRKGWLTVSYLPGRRLYVDKVVLPSSGDLWEWTNDFTITFRTYGVPFWQDELPVTAGSASIANGTVWLDVPGQFRTVADVTFRNISGMTISRFRVNAGGNEIDLQGISLGGSETLTLDHGTDGLLRIRIGSRSVYSCRTAGSADDLYLDPGSRSVAVNTERAGRLDVNVYGRYA